MLSTQVHATAIPCVYVVWRFDVKSMHMHTYTLCLGVSELMTIRVHPVRDGRTRLRHGLASSRPCDGPGASAVNLREPS